MTSQHSSRKLRPLQRAPVLALILLFLISQVGPVAAQRVTLSTGLESSWTGTATTGAPAGRIFQTAVYTGTEMVVWGGENGSLFNLTWLNTGGRYNPATNTWRPTSTTGAPSGRVHHTAIWTGDSGHPGEMIIWGGENGSRFNPTRLNTGGRYNPVTDTWQAISLVNAPSPRAYHTAVWTGSLMIIWGGTNGSDLNTGAVYNPVADTWTTITTSAAPTARHDHTAVWSGNEMIVWGGRDGSGALNTGARYNLTIENWTPITTSGAPSPRYFHAAMWIGSGPGALSEMIVWGGFDGSFYLNTGGRYNSFTGVWTTITTTDAPPGRDLHTAVWDGTEAIVWGGYDGSSYINTGARYNPASGAWTAITLFDAPTARSNHSAVWVAGGTGGTGAMIIWGGEDGAFINTGGRYKQVTDTWQQLPAAGAPLARDGHTAVWTGIEMIVWGGAGSNTGGRYNPATNTWRPTSLTNAPLGRSNHTAVWTGTEMIIWGGYGGGFLDTGGRYNPLTDSWTPITTTGAPFPRYGHTAIWTGTEMIVWGGMSQWIDFFELNTGGRYNPLTDTWTPTSTTGAPEARMNHTAVWTGDISHPGEMVIWGGGETAYYNTGGRYNPLTDSWTPTSTTGAPQGRKDHTAAWTGGSGAAGTGEMIIWGGEVSLVWQDGNYMHNLVNTGGRYNPLTDSWTPTSTTGAPEVRAIHTAVWTGSEMIVWGGFTSGIDYYYYEFVINTGGRYNPVSDTWLPDATTDAPSVRSEQTAVWTGSGGSGGTGGTGEMIVWGGFDGAGNLDTGGRYGGNGLKYYYSTFLPLTVR